MAQTSLQGGLLQEGQLADSPLLPHSGPTLSCWATMSQKAPSPRPERSAASVVLENFVRPGRIETMSQTQSNKPPFTYCESVSRRLNRKGYRPPPLHFPCGMAPVRSDASAEGRRGHLIARGAPKEKAPAVLWTRCGRGRRVSRGVLSTGSDWRKPSSRPWQGGLSRGT